MSGQAILAQLEKDSRLAALEVAVKLMYGETRQITLIMLALDSDPDEKILVQISF